LLVLEVFRYLQRRATKSPLRLANSVSFSQHHGSRATEPSVAIIIPSRNKYLLLKDCIDSIINKTTYLGYEILVVNNGSTDTKTLDYLKLIKSQGHTVIDFPEPFNYSKICNLAAACTSAEYLCFLNNDTVIMEPDWLGFLLDHATQPGVGLAGSKLVYQDGRLQHVGVALGYTGAAGHPFSGSKEDQIDFLHPSAECFQVSAVTFACAVVKRKTYLELGGLDERFQVGLNDVDFSLQLVGAGHQIAICTRSSLIHYESLSRKSMKSFSGSIRAMQEVMLFLRKWSAEQRRENYFQAE
jgi:GT2 family glycosyltransferase